MALPSILRQNNGFTLIEIMVVMVLLTMVFGLGLFMSFDLLKSYSIGSEKAVLVSLLQKARSQSLNNINQTTHGVHVENKGYVLFEGAAYNAASPNNLVITPSYNLSITSPTLPFDVIFDQLSGDCATPATIQFNNGQITINSVGQISW